MKNIFTAILILSSVLELKCYGQNYNQTLSFQTADIFFPHHPKDPYPPSISFGLNFHQSFKDHFGFGATYNYANPSWIYTIPNEDRLTMTFIEREKYRYFDLYFSRGIKIFRRGNQNINFSVGGSLLSMWTTIDSTIDINATYFSPGQPKNYSYFGPVFKLEYNINPIKNRLNLGVNANARYFSAPNIALEFGIHAGVNFNSLKGAGNDVVPKKSSDKKNIFNYALEIGIDMVQWTVKQDNPNNTDSYTEYNKTYSKPAPIIGIAISTTLHKHLILTGDFQYRKMNFIEHRHSDASDSILEITDDAFHKQVFEKLCLPITVGYQFGKKIHPTIYLGIEPNYIFKGTISQYENFVIDSAGKIIYWQNSSNWYVPGILETLSVNPFDPIQFARPASHWNTQVTGGFAISFLKHFQFNAGLHFGSAINFYDSSGANYIGVGYNADFSFTIKYYLKKLY